MTELMRYHIERAIAEARGIAGGSLYSKAVTIYNRLSARQAGQRTLRAIKTAIARSPAMRRVRQEGDNE